MYDEPLTAFTFAAVYLFLPSVPLTHALGLFAHCPRSAKARHVLLYPLKGGTRHTIFQTVAWAVWGLSVLVALPVLFPGKVAVRQMHVELLSGAAAIGGVFAELFMIKSLLVFDPDASSKKDDEVTWKTTALPSKPLASAVVVAMGLLWAMMAGALLLATEYLQNVQSRELYFVLAGLCAIIGATTTHGLAGSLRHGRAAKDYGMGWRFWQPFRGGSMFVATQALGWALFSVAIMLLVWLLTSAAQGVAYCMRCWSLATGSVMFAAQLMLGASIWTFKDKLPGSPRRGGRPAAGPLAPSETLSAVAARWATVWLPILMLYTPIHAFCCVITLSFMALPTAFAAAFWVGGGVLYYALTDTWNQPEHTGKREWPAFIKLLSNAMDEALHAWFDRIKVVREGKEPLLPDGKYIFGYAPHGLFPIGAAYLPLLPQFREMLPGIRPPTLIASVCFFTPVIRDLCMWCGLRQVTRRTFLHTLTERRSLVLVPGGQAELVHTWRLRRKREYVIYTRHKGFVRHALEQGASLVPILAFGEADSLHNLVDMPHLQQWSYKKLGFPVPYLLVGRWGLTPFPQRTNLLFVVGEPIAPPPHEPGTPADPAAVDKLHAQFYSATAALFEKHRLDFPGYEDVKLVMV